MLNFLLLLLGGYGALVAGMAMFQRNLMYFPDDRPLLPAMAEAAGYRQVALRTGDGLDLAAWYRPAARPGAFTVAYFHGNAGNAADRVERALPFIAAGHGMLLVEYRGYGGNPGKPTEQGLYADGAAALAFLIGAGGVSPKKAAVLGESLGSGVAVKLASENDLGAVLLFAPFTSAADVAAEVYPYLPARQLILDRYPNLERMAKVSAPVFVFQGEADEIIPVAHGRRILDSVTGRKEGVFLPGIGHNDWPIGPSSGRAALFLKALE